MVVLSCRNRHIAIKCMHKSVVPLLSSEPLPCRSILQNGYGLSDGTAGNAYAFLAMYKLTKKNLYLHMQGYQGMDAIYKQGVFF